MRAEGVEVVRRAITAKARTVNTAGAIVVRLAAAPVTMPKVFHLVITAVTRPYRREPASTPDAFQPPK